MTSVLNCFKGSSSKPPEKSEKPDNSSTTSAISNPASITKKASKHLTPYSTETSFHSFHPGYHYRCKPRNTPIDIIAIHGTLGDVNTTWDRGYPYSASFVTEQISKEFLLLLLHPLNHPIKIASFTEQEPTEQETKTKKQKQE
jgi:hypothetical protein